MRMTNFVREAETTVTLYRGDADEVEDFQISRADPDALLGQGIYMTDSRTIAKDYTVKGDTRVIARSEEGEAKQPREFMRRLLSERLHPIIVQLGKSFENGILHGAADMRRRFDEEIARVIGSGRMARYHPKYDKMINWRKVASRYVEAYLWKASEKLFWNAARQQYDIVYNEFKEDLEGTKMVRTVLDELVILPEDKVAPVSVFQVPKSYLDKTFYADEPMPNWLISWIIRFANEKMNIDVERQQVDLRYNDPEKGETHAEGFLDWLEQFQQYGMRYAWGDHNIGGEGENPSLLDFVWGTHFGQTLRMKEGFWKNIQQFLTNKGFVGFFYHGGLRTGPHAFTGGSPIQHKAYSFWNENDIRRFRKDTENVGIHSTDGRLFKRFQFPQMTKYYKEVFEYQQKDLKLRDELHNADQIEAVAQEWIDAGVLKRKLERFNETD